MKRTLVIAIMCMLLIATVGATAAVAKEKTPAGKSNVYQYDVKIDPAGTGKLVVNMKQGTFTFTGKGCEAGTYHLYYTSSAGRVDLGMADADVYGNLVISGKCTATVDELKTAKVDTTAPPAPIDASFTIEFVTFSDSTGFAIWQVDPRSSTGPITKYELTATYTERSPSGLPTTWVLMGSRGISTNSDDRSVEVTLTVYDASGNKDTMTKTVKGPVPIMMDTSTDPVGNYVPSGSELGIPQGETVTFRNTYESGTWKLYNPEWDPTPDDLTDDNGIVESTGTSVTVHSGLAPTTVNFYKAGSDLTTPDWTAIVHYSYPT